MIKLQIYEKKSIMFLSVFKGRAKNFSDYEVKFISDVLFYFHFIC